MTSLPCRNDPLVRFLNKEGYHPVVSARTNINPPEVYIFNHTQLIRWGKLRAMVPAGSLPVALAGGELPNFVQQETADKSASGAAAFLESVLVSLGVKGAPKVDLSVACNREVTFSLRGVTWKGVDPAEVSRALQAGFNLAGIPDDQVKVGMIHIAYEYVYANTLEMRFGRKGSGEVNLSAAEVDGIVELSGGAKVKLVDGTTVSFSGTDKPIAFGCKFGQVKRRHGGGWDFLFRERPGFGATADEAAPAYYMLRKGEVLLAEEPSRDTKSVPAEPIHPVPDSTHAHPFRAVPDSERQVSVWISEMAEDPVKPVRLGQTCTLNFRVGEPVRNSLVDGQDTVIPPEDVPEHGLQTEWVVTSEDVQLAQGTSDTAVTEAVFEGRPVWTARFELLIPRSGDSTTPQLMATPRRASEPRLDVLINVRGEIYREFKVRLHVGEAVAPPAAARIVDDMVHTPVAHLGLQPPYEWTTPPGTLTLGVGERKVFVKGAAGPIDVDDQVPWDVVPALVSGRIDNVRAAAEQFRGDWGRYLDDIDPNDLVSRLDQWSPDYDWTSLIDRSDERHRQQWEREVSVSKQLRVLAFEGRKLYDAFFPPGSALRAWIDALEPGYRLNISWTPRSGPAWVPHVPWGLMYVGEVPLVGQPVDPISFLGIRLRIGYRAHDVQAASKGLGSLNATFRAHFLYWGSDPQDPVGQESRRQRTDWSRWTNQVFVPSAQPPADAKGELLRVIGRPQPAPTAVLYLFCHCNLGQGNDPVLRFGPTSEPEDTVARTDLATAPLDDRPFVFVNACATGAADAYMANELEAGFFDRGCRAFLGTETKVPIAFASRFATIFFRFFYRSFAPAPLAAGEAVAQTRLFLWTRYRNIGGLFYSYVNQYELFMAPDEEVRTMRL